MALRAIVSNNSLRAVVNTDSPESVNVFKRFRAILSTSNVKAVVDYSYLQPITVFSDLRVLTEYVDLNYGVDFLNLSAVDIVLDADSKNLYFAPGYQEDKALTVTITESLANAIAKTVTADTTSILEAAALEIGKPAADSVSFSDVVVTLLVFERAFSDTLGVAESYVSNFGKNPSDSANVAESYASSFSKAASDSASISESYTPDFGKNPADTVSVAESFASVRTFVRAFSDAYSLDDTASAEDDLATESGLNKNNVVSIGESLDSFAVSKPFSDTPTISESFAHDFSPATIADSTSVGEAHAVSFGQATTDSVSVSESINVQLIAGSTSGALLNKSALNTYSINS